MFITNSHCVYWWGNQGTSEYGRSSSSPGLPDSTFHYIGGEMYDPWPYDTPCGAGCRYSDAAVIWHGTTEYRFASIARTTYTAFGWGIDGSLEISSSNPHFQIVGKQAYSMAGIPVSKMGANTGWTIGYITETCEDLVVPEHAGNYYRCQDEASYYSYFGDSGAPVFIDHGDGTATLVGIDWGHDPSIERSALSPISGVETDLGYLQVTPPAPPPTLSAYIDGPSDVIPFSWSCGWLASVTGGTTPYTYQWSGVKSGTDVAVWGSPSASGWLYLQVNSADGQQVNTDLFINVYEEAPAC